MPPRAISTQAPNTAMSTLSKAGPSKKPNTASYSIASSVDHAHTCQYAEGHDSDFKMDDTMLVKTLLFTASINNSTPAVNTFPHLKRKMKEEELDYSDVTVANDLPSGFYRSVDSRLEAASKNALSNIDPDSDLQFEKDKRILHLQYN